MEHSRIQELTNKIAEETAQANNESDVVEHGSLEPKRRARSMTTLKLQWLAERVRKCRNIKSLVASGSYKIDSHKVAKAILNLDMIEEEKK